jgi:pyridoxal phosphate enzyme (YggS family)
VDSADLARALDRSAEAAGRVLPVLLEVNTSGEPSKTGIAPQQFSELADGVLACSHLRLEGLMTIGPLTDDEARIRDAFASLREMASRARIRSGLLLPVLSMGMSGDFEWAILEGSTMVRIGPALFGARPRPQSK